MTINEFETIIKEMRKNIPINEELFDIFLKLCWNLKLDFDTTYHVCRFVWFVSNANDKESVVEGKKIGKEVLDKIYERMYKDSEYPFGITWGSGIENMLEDK